MQIKNHMSVLLLVGVVGALGLASFVGSLLWDLQRASETSGRASEEFQRVQTLLADCFDLLGILDILSSESSGAFVIAERLVERNHADVEGLRGSNIFSKNQLLDEVSATIEVVVQKGAAVAFTGESGEERDKALDEFDEIAEYLVTLLDRVEEHAASYANQEELSLSARRARTFWIIGIVLAVYLAVVLFVQRWTTGELVHPVQRLAGAANRAMLHQEPFALEEKGPREVRDLTRAVGSFVGSLESKVQKRTSELEKEIAEHRITEEKLRDATELAEAANKTKSEFLANMSHELRTPMNAIISYSEMLQEDAEDLGQESFISDLKKINSAGEHLLSLINDVLDLSKIEAGKMELYLEDFEVAPTIEEVINTIQPLAAKNSNRLEVHCPKDLETIRCDLTKLRQTLFNLLSNACKFCDKGTITLSVTDQTQGRRRMITFTVTDTGIGIAPDQLGKVFEEFSQVHDSSRRNYGGTGLGLPISRRFCQLMGGDIKVESELGRGTTFTATIPAHVVEVAPDEADALPRDDGAHPAPEGEPTPTAERLRTQTDVDILVIDDDPVARDLMIRTFSKEGYGVATASNGKEGLEQARAIHPSAIILDVMMPVADGWAVLKELKADLDLCDIPVIMVTVLHDRNMGFALGATEFLTKPVERERLLGVLRGLQSPTRPRPALIIDDDPFTRDSLGRILVQEGWEKFEAENGKVALDLMRGSKPGLIFLDLMMPVMDGYEFILEMRKNESWRSIPVVVLTAKDLTQEDRFRLQGSVEKILQKGAFTKEQLLSEVRDLLAVHTKRGALARKRKA